MCHEQTHRNGGFRGIWKRWIPTQIPYLGGDLKLALLLVVARSSLVLCGSGKEVMDILASERKQLAPELGCFVPFLRSYDFFVILSHHSKCLKSTFLLWAAHDKIAYAWCAVNVGEQLRKAGWLHIRLHVHGDNS